MAQRSCRILVVEDDCMVRDFAISLLRRLGHEPLPAHNAEKALERLAEDPHIDLLFTDVVMPGSLSGAALAEEARRLRPELPILLTSGYPGNELPESGPRLPILAKPYRRRDLEAALAEALGESD